MAEVKNLRAGTERFRVSDQGWSMPAQVDSRGEVRREQHATITAGQATELTITLEPTSPGESGP